MGTLFNQSPRMDKIDNARLMSYGKGLKEISEDLNITFGEAVELMLMVMKLDDYDAKDEQLMGFGEIIQDLVYAIKGE